MEENEANSRRVERAHRVYEFWFGLPRGSTRHCRTLGEMNAVVRRRSLRIFTVALALIFCVVGVLFVVHIFSL